MSSSAGQRVLGLDIVRASAILLVLLSHYSIDLWPKLTSEPVPPIALQLPGLFGVQLFFGLSGYLIGNILLGVVERELTIDTLWRFWVRRWLRTLPVYYLAIVLAIWTSSIIGHADYNFWPYLTLSQNLFGMSGTLLGVSWSLTIEEWFYLLFPLLLLATLGLSRRYGMLIALAFVIVGSAVARHIAWTQYGVTWVNGLRTMVPFQLDSIAYGALAALIVRGRNVDPLSRKIAATAGFALMVVCWNSMIDGSASVIFWSNGIFIGTAAGGALIAIGFAGLAAAPRVIAIPAKFLSLHSYTLYLVHMECMDLSAHWVYLHLWPTWTMFFLGPLSGFGVAMLITRFVEVPIMLRRPKQFAEERLPDYRRLPISPGVSNA